MIKKEIKNIIGPYLSNFNYPIIVNSYGRSGSSVLKRSIIQSSIIFKNKRVKSFAYPFISQTAWNLNDVELNGGIVYKTHDYPPIKELKKNVRMLYTFADPVDVVVSLLRLYDKHGVEWMKKHYDHLKVSFAEFQDIIKEDQLQLERHLNAWLNVEGFPIAFIKYETMWGHQDEISEFLGFKVELPSFRKRKSKKENDTARLDYIKSTYISLVDKINNLENFFIKNTVHANI